MGSHYGVKIRSMETKILQKMRQRHACPKCEKKSVKRKGNSMWQCNSCGAEFAGGAYMPQTDIGVTAKKIVSSIKQ